MKLTSFFLGLAAFSTFISALPVSPNGEALTTRAECDDGYYGKQIEEWEYMNYLTDYYPDTDKYMLYSAGSDNQCVNFQQSNPGYYWYDDFFNADVSEHYTKRFPPHPDDENCWRMDNGEASSIAIAKTASTEIIVFGAVEWHSKGRDSFFATKEVEWLQTNITAGTLNKITHMVRDATDRQDILATEDANENLSFADGHNDDEANASGTFGDCTSTLDPPTCDIPSQGNGH